VPDAGVSYFNSNGNFAASPLSPSNLCRLIAGDHVAASVFASAGVGSALALCGGGGTLIAVAALTGGVGVVSRWTILVRGAAVVRTAVRADSGGAALAGELAAGADLRWAAGLCGALRAGSLRATLTMRGAIAPVATALGTPAGTVGVFEAGGSAGFAGALTVWAGVGAAGGGAAVRACGRRAASGGCSALAIGGDGATATDRPMTAGGGCASCRGRRGGRCGLRGGTSAARFGLRRGVDGGDA